MSLQLRGCPPDLIDGAFFRGRIYKRTPLENRLSDKVNFLGSLPEYNPSLGSCWLWTGSKDPNGYGHIWDGARRRLTSTHRAMYELMMGPIPEGLVMDHLCRVPACCNPLHLEPVTQYENMQRSFAPTMITQRSRVCKRGHKIEPRVECRKCANIKAKERYYARRDYFLAKQKVRNSDPNRKKKMAEYYKEYYQSNKERLKRTPEQRERANELKRQRRLSKKNPSRNELGS